VEQHFSDEAEPLLKELYETAQQVQLNPRSAAGFTSFYGPCLAQLGRYSDAEAPLREAYARMRVTQQEKRERTRIIAQALAEVCEHTDRRDEAARWRAELQSLAAATRPVSRPATQAH
jgi:hypothetical protein